MLLFFVVFFRIRRVVFISISIILGGKVMYNTTRFLPKKEGCTERPVHNEIRECRWNSEAAHLWKVGGVRLQFPYGEPTL